MATHSTPSRSRISWPSRINSGIDDDDWDSDDIVWDSDDTDNVPIVGSLRLSNSEDEGALDASTEQEGHVFSDMEGQVPTDSEEGPTESQWDDGEESEGDDLPMDGSEEAEDVEKVQMNLPNELDRYWMMDWIPSFTAISGEEIRRGNNVLIRSSDLREQLWNARVVDIRLEVKHGEDNRIWVKVHWYYSKQDLLPVIERKKSHDPKWRPPFNVKRLGRMEFVETPHHPEIYSSILFERLSNIEQLRDYDECNIQKLPLNPNTTFSRIVWYWNNWNGHIDQVMPKNQCICGTTGRTKYLEIEDLERFCPTSVCRRWMHEKCLRESCSMPQSEELAWKDNICDKDAIDVSTYLLRPDEIPTTGMVRPLDPNDSEVFRGMKLVANRPISRTINNPFGNMNEVCVARLLLQFHHQGHPLNLQRVADLSGVQQANHDPDAHQNDRCYWCPRCHRPI